MCFSFDIHKDLEELANLTGANINQKAFDYHESMLETPYFQPITTKRLYTKNWCPILISRNNRFELRPMRYQLLPHFCEEPRYTKHIDNDKRKEINSTYNTRLENIQTARAWKRPFMKFHGIVLMKSFYEWVYDKGKKKQINIFEKNNDLLFTPCLFDIWKSQDEKVIIQSFSIITQEATLDIKQLGHQRRPTHIESKDIKKWLEPNYSNPQELIHLLKAKNKFHYLGQDVSEA